MENSDSSRWQCKNCGQIWPEPRFHACVDRRITSGMDGVEKERILKDWFKPYIEPVKYRLFPLGNGVFSHAPEGEPDPDLKDTVLEDSGSSALASGYTHFGPRSRLPERVSPRDSGWGKSLRRYNHRYRGGFKKGSKV